MRSLSARGKPKQGSRGGRTDPGHRVFLKAVNCRQRLVEPVAGHHLQCHLANPPGVIVPGLPPRTAAPRPPRPRAARAAPRPSASRAGPGGSPVTTQRAGGPPRARTSSASTSRRLSSSMQPATTAPLPRFAHSCSMLSRGVLPQDADAFIDNSVGSLDRSAAREPNAHRNVHQSAIEAE